MKCWSLGDPQKLDTGPPAEEQMMEEDWTGQMWRANPVPMWMNENVKKSDCLESFGLEAEGSGAVRYARGRFLGL